MLRLDANKILNQSYVVFVTLIYMTYQSYQYLLSIYSWDCGLYVVVLCVPLLFFFQSLFLILFRVVLIIISVIKTLVMIIIISFIKFFCFCFFLYVLYVLICYYFPFPLFLCPICVDLLLFPISTVLMFIITIIVYISIFINFLIYFISSSTIFCYHSIYYRFILTDFMAAPTEQKVFPTPLVNSSLINLISRSFRLC